MSIRTIRKILLVCLLLALAILAIPILFHCSQTVQTLCKTIGIGVLIIFLMISYRMRCPHCDRCIFTKGGWLDMQYCPYCGEELDVY